MAYRSTPREQTFPSLATRKRMAAAKREREAARLRAEADALDLRWREYEAARRDAGQPATQVAS